MKINPNIVALFIVINNESQVRDIQNEFHAKFPYLKIEFYRESKGNTAQPGRLEKISPLHNFSLLKKVKDNITIEFNSGNKVSELKAQLREILGLNILIFRKSGAHWIETSLTEDWTLEQQNEEGKLLSDI